MYDEISVTALKNAGGDAFVIDVREGWEYHGGHVPGALNLPLGELVAAEASLPRDRDVYVICQSGGRSMQAAVWISQTGRTAHSIAGGTSAWQQSGLQVETGAA